MTNILSVVAILTGMAQSMKPVEGTAQCYADGVMKNVAENRMGWGHIPADTDYRTCVAVTDCSWVGREVGVVWPDGRVMYGTVCDCSADEDRQRHIDKGLAVEVSWWAAGEYAHEVGKYLLPRQGPLPGVKVVLLPEGRGG